MAYNDRKILEVLIAQLDSVPDRCKGYKSEFSHLVGDVLQLERSHSIARTSIVPKIGDQVNTVGMYLHNTRAAAEENED